MNPTDWMRDTDPAALAFLFERRRQMTATEKFQLFMDMQELGLAMERASERTSFPQASVLN